MKKIFESKKPIMVMFCQTQWGERKIVVPLVKDLCEKVKEPFFKVEKECFFLGTKVVPSAIKGGPPQEHQYGGVYDNDVLIRSNSIVEISIVESDNPLYDGLKKTYEEILADQSKKEDEKA